jgi:hypothetical protein
MMHPNTEVRHARAPIGVGVFATADIPRGTIVWILDRFDRIVQPDTLRTWPPEIRAVAERYGYIDPDGAWVICWDSGRLVNHSCDPATVSLGYGLEIARRDIRAGDEVTCDYGTLNLTGVLRCLCGALTCRGDISAGSAETLCEMWDGWAREAFAAALDVAQPLLPYARGDGTDTALLAAIAGGRHVDLPPVQRVVRHSHEQTPVGADGRLWVME